MWLPLSDVLHNQDEYTPINSQYAIGIHGYILVYSITSRNSFNLIQGVYDKILNFCGLPKIACVIVGSKSDLSMAYVTSGYYLEFVLRPHLRRQVDSTDGQRLAKENDCAWIETSAKNGTNISALYILSTLICAEICLFPGKVFDLCLAEIEKHTAPNQTEPPSRSCLIM